MSIILYGNQLLKSVSQKVSWFDLMNGLVAHEFVKTSYMMAAVVSVIMKTKLCSLNAMSR